MSEQSSKKSKVVIYKGVTLATNSIAYELHQNGKFKELEAHMKEVEHADRKRTGDPTEAIAKCRALMAERGFAILA